MMEPWKGKNLSMEIFTLLETLEEHLEKGKTLPFTDKCIVEKEELLELIKEIRLNLPDELKHYCRSTKRCRRHRKRSRK